MKRFSSACSYKKELFDILPSRHHFSLRDTAKSLALFTLLFTWVDHSWNALECALLSYILLYMLCVFMMPSVISLWDGKVKLILNLIFFFLFFFLKADFAPDELEVGVREHILQDLEAFVRRQFAGELKHLQ